MYLVFHPCERRTDARLFALVAKFPDHDLLWFFDQLQAHNVELAKREQDDTIMKNLNANTDIKKTISYFIGFR